MSERKASKARATGGTGTRVARAAARPKDRARRDVLAAVAKAREAGAVSASLSDGDVAGVVTPVIDALYDAYEEGGDAPTREAFSERCGREDVGRAVLGMSRDPFAARRPRRGAVAAICAGCALALAVACGGVALSLSPGGDPSGNEAEGAPDAAVADDGADAEAAEEADTGAAEASQAESTAQTGQDNGSVTSAGEAAPSSGGSASESPGGSTPSAGSTGSTGSSSSTPGGSGSGSSGGSGSSSSSSATHTHNWLAQTTTLHHDAVYKTVHHDAVYTTVHHDAVTEDRTICNNCGADITGNVDAHMKANILNGCGSYSIKTVVVQAAWDEQVLASAAWDEQVLVSTAWDETVTTGYRCPGCGATR